MEIDRTYLSERDVIYSRMKHYTRMNIIFLFFPPGDDSEVVRETLESPGK